MLNLRMRMALGANCGALLLCIAMTACSPTRSNAPPAAAEVEAVGAEGTPPSEEPAAPTAEAVERANRAAREAVTNAVTRATPEAIRVTPCAAPPEGMACVPGGWFTRGVPEPLHVCDQSDQGEGGDIGAHPEARVWLDSFFIHQTEVTHAAYQQCAASGGCPPARPLYRDYDAPTQPMTGMSWFDADAYCRAQGMRLPSEAQFEAASRGPNGELYPWGDAPATCDRAIIMDERGRACGVPKRGSSPETGRIWEVGSRPAGRYGLYDMVGNAEEWVADWWTPSYGACGEACEGIDPRGPCAGEAPCEGHRYRVVRGGSWYWPVVHATGIHRRRYAPANQPAHHFGFRCAVTVRAYQAPEPPESGQ
jgi:formylglycine-generating enzyme required for sulfatase activity